MTAKGRGLQGKPLGLAALAALVVMGLGGLMTDLGPWSQSLRTPAWKPPDWAFGPIWTTIFALWGAAAYLAWRRAPDDPTRLAAAAGLAANGFLNVLWSALFFRLRHPDWALVEVVPLWLSIVMAMALLWRCSKLASLLLLPYLVWVSIAAALTLEIVRLNQPFS